MFAKICYPHVEYYFALQLNNKMDDKWLDQAIKQFDKVQSQGPDQKQNGKYLFMLNQWLD